MMFILSGLFWSGVLVLLGICVILNVVLRTHIPFARIFFGLLLVYVGLSLLLGRSRHERRWHRYKTPERVQITEPSEQQDVVFANRELDLTGLKLEDKVLHEELDVVFGSAVVKVSPAVPLRIEVSSAFAEARLPNGNDVGFGDEVYKSKNLDPNQPYLLLKADVVFGQLEIRYDSTALPQSDSATRGKGVL
jgi:hypothetical protein